MAMLRSVIALLLLTTGALAQDNPYAPAPPAPAQRQQSPSEQAIGQKLISEINENINLRAQVLELQKQVDEAKKKPAGEK